MTFLNLKKSRNSTVADSKEFFNAIYGIKRKPKNFHIIEIGKTHEIVRNFQ